MSYSRVQPWIVCFSAALFFFFEFLQLNIFNALGPYLAKEFNANAPLLATISDKYFLANIIFLFPAGIILDRVSTRWIILTGLLISVLCTYLFGNAFAIWQMKIARFITGVVGAFCFLSCVRLASRWFLPKQMALVIGLIVTFAMTGGMLAQAPLIILIRAAGWRNAVMIDALFGLALFVIAFFFIRDYPPNRLTESEKTLHSPLHGIEFWRVLARTLKHPQNWLCGLYTSFMNLPIFLLGAIWGIFYLTQVRNFSNELASLITLSLFLGVIIGSPVVGWFSDFFQRRKLPMILGAIISFILILLLMFLPQLSFGTAEGLFFGIGFATSTQIISYPLIAESNPIAVTATAEGLASTFIMAGGFTQDLFAYLMQLGWDNEFIHGTPVYSEVSYLGAMSIMPIAFLLSMLLTFFLRESYCKPYITHEIHHG